MKRQEQSAIPAPLSLRVLRRRVRTATILALHPSMIPRLLRYGPSGGFPVARYENLWREVRRLRPSRILEIGVWRGETASRLIENALGARDHVDYWGFDLFKEGMTPELLEAEASDWPLSVAEVTRRLERPGATIHLIPGDTKVTLATADVPPADLVFIDGGHSFETVSSDWNNVQRFLHSRSVVYFDDYTNRAAEIHEHYGVSRLVDGLDRSVWHVELLQPVDTYWRPYGVMESRFVRVTRVSG